MRIGYARVSTTEQNLGLRQHGLKPAFDASVDPTNGNIFSGNPYCIGVYVENYGLFIKAITIE